MNDKSEWPPMVETMRRIRRLRERGLSKQACDLLRDSAGRKEIEELERATPRQLRELNDLVRRDADD